MNANAAEYISLATTTADEDIVGHMKILNIGLSGIDEVIKGDKPILWETAF
jgi:hypothetical protein